MHKSTPKSKNINLNVFTILFFLLGYHIVSAQVGIGTVNPLSTFEVNGSLGQTVTTVTSDLTLDASHRIVICNNGSTARTITLPTAVGIKGRTYTIKRDNTSSANVTIATTLSQTIDGETTYILTDAKESVTFISDGSDWKKVSGNGSNNIQYPMGEISYFDLTGKTINITSATTDGSANMFLCDPETTFSSDSFGFSNGGANTGRLKYVGTVARTFHITYTLSAVASVSGTFIFELKKSGTYLSNSRVIQKLTASDAQSATITVFVTLSPDDYLELWVGNTFGAADVTIKSLNLFASGM